MNTNDTKKLDILNKFNRKYPQWINPNLVSFKYCQTEVEAYLEMTFGSVPADPVLLNLDFISGDEDPASEIGFALLFNPDADIVDNATAFVELDTYSLINCVDGLFTKEAEILINDNYHATVNK